MKIFKKPLVAAVTLSLCVVTGQLVFGGEHPIGKREGHMKEFCLRSLNLSEDQRMKVQKILADHRTQIKALRDELEQKRKAFHEAVQNSENEQNIRRAFQELSKVRENLIVQRVSMLKGMKSILSEQQKSQFEACIKRRTADSLSSEGE
ncbi:MAG: periplasmic heavy metal sensor [Thermoproteota archaeon]